MWPPSPTLSFSLRRGERKGERENERDREREREREKERERERERERRRGGGVLHRPLALRVRGRRVESYNFIMEVKIQEIAISTNLSSVQSGSESPEGQALSVISL